MKGAFLELRIIGGLLKLAVTVIVKDSPLNPNDVRGQFDNLNALCRKRVEQATNAGNMSAAQNSRVTLMRLEEIKMNLLSLHAAGE